MKILYVLNSARYGGMEWHVSDLVRGMVSNGNEVFVWCPNGEMSEVYKRAGAKVTERSITKDIDRKYIKDLSLFIKENGIDIVHSHELKAVCNALRAGKKSGVKVSVTHTHTPISQWEIGKFKKYLNIKFYSHFVNKYSSVEIALTESTKRVKVKEGIKENKIVVIPNGIDTTKFDITPNLRAAYQDEIKKRYQIPKTAFVFGTLGRLTEEKGIDSLIKAFENFTKLELFHKRDFYLMIVGGGRLEEELRSLIEELNLDGKVIITGYFDEAEKVKYYSTFDAFVFPSLAEGFGIVLIEALYMGIPTICSDIEVLTEVGGGVAEYFERGNVNDIANKMTTIYKKVAEEGITVSEKSRLWVEKEYSMQKFISNYLNLYKKLLGE